MATIDILVGSVYGAANDTAWQIAGALDGAGHHTSVYEQPRAEQVCDSAERVLLFVTSTTGAGELPPALVPLWAELRDRFPMLPRLRYGMVVQGDSSYDTFCGGGRMLDELMQELQAQRLGDRLEIDATQTAEPASVAVPWALAWAERL